MKSNLLIFSKSIIKNCDNLPVNFPYLGGLWRKVVILLEIMNLASSYWFQ